MPLPEPVQNGPPLYAFEGAELVVDGSGRHADVDKIDEAANGIQQSVQDQDSFELRGLCGDPELYGYAPLHDALMDFSVRWSDGLDTPTGDAREIGDARSRVSKAYHAVNEAPPARYKCGSPDYKPSRVASWSRWKSASP